MEGAEAAEDAFCETTVADQEQEERREECIPDSEDAEEVEAVVLVSSAVIEEDSVAKETDNEDVL